MANAVLIPPCPFASVHWFRLAGTDPTLDIHSPYVKQSYRNRFEIIGVNGKVALTFPVHGQKGMKIPMKEIKLVAGNWPRQHLGAIRSGYGRAAFFEYYIDDIEIIYRKKYTYLLDLTMDTLIWYQKAGVLINYNLSESAARFETDEISLQLEPSFIAPLSPPYPQVFTDRHGFTDGLSVVDVIMHQGPQSRNYLLSL